MTAKEKAIELVDWFGQHSKRTTYGFDFGGDIDHSVESALICVEQLLLFAYSVEWEKKEDALSKIKFLKKVKREINKL
jgi:hypothetical protein